MAIYRLLKNSTLAPEEINRITEAYEQALHTLCVRDRDDLLTEMIAKTIIKIAQTGVHDAAQRPVKGRRLLAPPFWQKNRPQAGGELGPPFHPPGITA